MWGACTTRVVTVDLAAVDRRVGSVTSLSTSIGKAVATATARFAVQKIRREMQRNIDTITFQRPVNNRSHDRDIADVFDYQFGYDPRQLPIDAYA